MLNLSADHITCRRGGEIVLSQLSFALSAGEFMELRGPNGSGKSTLLRHIAGLGDISAGKLVLSGDGQSHLLSEQCHYIAHQNAIKSSFTVLENLQFWSRYFGGNLVSMEVLDYFDLQPLAHQQAGLLSEGQKRRLALTRLCLAPRPIWLLDEAHVGLDQKACQNLNQLIAQHCATGGIVIASTHVNFGIKVDHTLNLTAAPS